MSEVYTKGTRIWIADKDQGWISAEITAATSVGDNALKLTFVDERGKEHSLDTSKEEAPPLRNPPLLEAVDDLATLSHLNEPSVLHTIRNRYAQHSIYTYSGIVLIAMNPFQRVTLYGPEIIQAYVGRRKGELEPHLFAIAEDAYTRMRRDNIGQTIIVSGESGAGKTESAKLIMRFLASVNGDTDGTKVRGKAVDESTEVEQQMLATNPILEAFGNAKTTRNDNSSRFGKYLQILFDGKQQIVGARIRTYLLERSRLVFQPETERNYHIFYQLCGGAPMKERRDYRLDGGVTSFHYLRQGGDASVTIPGVDDAEEFRATQTALSTVGISVEKQWAVFKLLAALLHLGNVKIIPSRNDCNIDDVDPALQTATQFLGVRLEEFKKWTVKKQITTRTEKIVTSLNAQQATVVRDSVAKFVYACMFEWLVAVVNESLVGENGEGANRAEYFIGVLDIYGFEHFKKNSFEQFCINYANEKLQQEFNAHVFKLEQEEYVREQINWTFIEFSDNQACIDIIEGKLGVLALLDEESRLPAGTDQSFVQKLYSQLDKPTNKDTFKKPRFGSTAFTIAHYALDVTYESEGFIEKNRDTVPDEHLTLLSTTRNTFLKEVLDAALASSRAADGPPVPPASPAPSEGSTSSTNKRASIIPDPGRASLTSGGGKGGKPGAVAKKPTLGSIFKGSLINLMDTIGTTNAHYIRCIKPNEAKKAWEFVPQQVLGQLRACGVLETIRISCAGYPTRWTFEEFAERYYMLVPSANWGPQIKELCMMILGKTIKDEDKYQVGLTKIFFRAGMLAFLEGLRSDRLNYLVTAVQKNMKRMMLRKKYIKMRASAIKIQTWWRGIMARRLVLSIRKEVAAKRYQCLARRYIQRKQFVDVRNSVILVQSRIRGARARRAYLEERTKDASVRLQSLLRGLLARRNYKREVHLVIYLQCCLRRRLARKELKHLRAEARSVSKFKEISYKLENKVVELTQTLQQRTHEKKELNSRLAELEQQLANWQAKHSEADTKAKQLQAELQSSYVPSTKFEEIMEMKTGIESRLAESAKKVTDQEEMIHKLTEDLQKQAQKLEEKSKLTINGTAPRPAGEDPSVLSLKNELATLREQLNRANALNALTKGVREPPSPTFGYSLRPGAPIPAPEAHVPNGTSNPTTPVSNSKRHMRRHSSAGTYAVDSMQSFGELSTRSGRDPSGNRAVSVAFTGPDGAPMFNRHMPPMGLESITDDPVEDKIRLLEDEKNLDDDVLQGLIRGLKVPQASANNTPSLKEVLFPANLISLITNEMWKYGLIAESERFLANVMQTIQSHVMSFSGEDAIVPGVFWLSNVHEILSFICVAESDMLQGIGPTEEAGGREFEWKDYERLVGVVKHDLDSLEYNIYHSWMSATKARLAKMIVPALIESQALPGFQTKDGGGRLFNRLLNVNTTPQYSMDDILNLLNKVYKTLKCYYMEDSVVQQVIIDLLKLIGVNSFNDLLMRRNFCSWKRAMQIQYNITRIEEWCKSHDMPEGTLQLEHLMQATKLLQLKKASAADIEIIYDVCWMLSPSQIQRMCTNYFVADYENPISPEILKVVASRVRDGDRNDHLLLTPETEEAGPYELPMPREVSGLETYVPAYLNVPHVRRLAALLRSLTSRDFGRLPRGVFSQTTIEPPEPMNVDDETAPTSPRLSLIPVSQADREAGWRPILEASNQVVLYNPSSHALTVTSTTPSRALQPASGPSRNGGTFLHEEPSHCPYCRKPLNEDTSTGQANPGSHSDFQRYGHYTDPHSRVPNYFQLLAQANESSRPTTPAPYGLHTSSATSSVHLEAEEDAEKPFTDNTMAQGYFTAFFREKRRLGMGANGTVLLCEHVLDGNVLGEYAVKKVAVGQSHDYLVNILREVRLLEKLRHPNIVTYHHAWLESSRFSAFGDLVPTLFILMQFAEGGSLDTWIASRSTSSTLFNDPNHNEESTQESKSARIRAFREQQQRGIRSSPILGANREMKAVHLLSVEELRSLFGDIATGLAFLHDRSILHLDLKPGNILLTFDEGKLIPRAMLSDFGTSRDMLASRSRSGNTGTLEYAAPETLDAKRSVDSKADMWSLGMILHKLLFFRLPYTHDDIAGLEREVSEYSGFKPDNDTINTFARRGLPSPILYLLQSLLSTEPHKRPTSSQVLAAMTSGKFDPIVNSRPGPSLPVVLRSPEITTRRQPASPTTPTSRDSPPVSPVAATKPSSHAEELCSVIMNALAVHQDEWSINADGKGMTYETLEEEALILALWRIREGRKEEKMDSEGSDGEITPPSRMMPGGFLAIADDNDTT